MTNNYYKILNIPQDASTTDIKRAFRIKAKEFHPELNSSSDAEDNFVLVNEAYDILTHPKSREIHDAGITSFLNPTKHHSYSHWLNTARERAIIHLRLPYNEFVKTKFYHSTHTYPYLLYLSEFIVGIGLLVFSLLILNFTEIDRVLTVIIFIISLPVAIFLLVQAGAGFASMSKFRKTEKKKSLKAA